MECSYRKLEFSRYSTTAIGCDFYRDYHVIILYFIVIQLIQLEKLGFSLNRFQYQKRSRFFHLDSDVDQLSMDWSREKWTWNPMVSGFRFWCSQRLTNPLRRSEKDNLLAADRAADRFGSDIFFGHFRSENTAHMFKMFEDLWHSIIASERIDQLSELSEYSIIVDQRYSIFTFMAASEHVFLYPPVIATPWRMLGMADNFRQSHIINYISNDCGVISPHCTIGINRG